MKKKQKDNKQTTQIGATIDSQEYKELQLIAGVDKRSISNLISLIISYWLEARRKS